MFAGILLACAGASALLASWVPLQFSVVTVFLFAGPHNWFELRYFLSRLPVRFGKSRTFFLTAFAGIGVLTLTYVSLPLLYRFTNVPAEAWPTVIASWNTLVIALDWFAGLVARQKQTEAQLVVGVSGRPRLEFFELAGAGILQPRNCLPASTRGLVVFGSAPCAHASALATHVSPLFVFAAAVVVECFGNWPERPRFQMTTVCSGESRSMPARNCCPVFPVTCW